MNTSRALIVLPLLFACGGKKVDNTPDFDPVAKLAEGLSGTFDSRKQSEEDPEYYAISLVTCAVDAPELGDTVLYVEQAVADTPLEPYRQRLYAITAEDAVEGAPAARSTIYSLADEGAAIGLCGESERRTFAAADVTEREGCDVLMVWQGTEFAGLTGVGTCKSTLRGADSATSEVRVDGTKITSWDRGYNAAGEQVWGATKGPYIFLRK